MQAGQHFSHLKLGVSEKPLHDGSEASGAGATGDSLPRNGAQGPAGHAQLCRVHLEHRLVLLAQGILGIAQHSHQLILCESLHQHQNFSLAAAVSQKGGAQTVAMMSLALLLHLDRMVQPSRSLKGPKESLSTLVVLMAMSSITGRSRKTTSDISFIQSCRWKDAEEYIGIRTMQIFHELFLSRSGNFKEASP